MLIENKGLAPEKIKGNVAILCSLESLKYAEDLISRLSRLNDISLYIENNDKVSIYNGKPEVMQLKVSNSGLQLECTLNQCFSPLEYSCTICIGKNKSFSSIAELCSKYATPMYMLESYEAA